MLSSLVGGALTSVEGVVGGHGLQVGGLSVLQLTRAGACRESQALGAGVVHVLVHYLDLIEELMLQA